MLPEFSFGKGRTQINLKGKVAIQAGGWAIRMLLAARAFALLLPAIAIVMAWWRLS